MVATGYSIWLMPTGDVHARLFALMRELAKDYSTPVFEPHVTLIGGLLDPEGEMLSKMSRLARLLRPFSVRLGGVAHLDGFFTCLFIRVEETQELLAANREAREIFDRSHDPKFVPHLSLMYGNLSRDIKTRIISQIGSEFHMSFEARSLHPFRTSGPVESWRRIHEFRLTTENSTSHTH